MDPFIRQFRQTVDRAAAQMRAMPESAAALRPSPGKWSAKEIVVHLIDSASNNHGRFVRAALQDDMVFPGYDQDAWVVAQRYQEAPWPTLVGLWYDYNHYLAHVMASVPAADRLRPRPRHNLHQVAWQGVPEDQPATLDFFMRDYVAHMEHHLRQVFPDRGGR